MTGTNTPTTPTTTPIPLSENQRREVELLATFFQRRAIELPAGSPGRRKIESVLARWEHIRNTRPQRACAR